MIECQASVSLSPVQLNKFRIGRKDKFLIIISVRCDYDINRVG